MPFWLTTLGQNIDPSTNLASNDARAVYGILKAACDPQTKQCKPLSPDDVFQKLKALYPNYRPGFGVNDVLGILRQPLRQSGYVEGYTWNYIPPADSTNLVDRILVFLQSTPGAWIRRPDIDTKFVGQPPDSPFVLTVTFALGSLRSNGLVNVRPSDQDPQEYIAVKS
jgi:hypothetical protein